MQKKWQKAVIEMMNSRDRYSEIRQTSSVSVHKSVIRRALPLLCAHIPDAAGFYTEEVIETMIDEVCCPDSSSDYEKGAGRHYYCGSNSFGMKLIPLGGYYRNGIFRFSKSARTMLEEDYTMALTMWRAGYKKTGIEYFARAIHMLADMCCLPHASRMTYMSHMGKVHKAYESLARAMYPDSVPEDTISSEQLHVFDDRNSFGAVLNNIVSSQRGEVKRLLYESEKAITERLLINEKYAAAFMLRFFEDISSEPEKANYLVSGMKIRGIFDNEPLTIDVKEDGIRLLRNDTPIDIRINRECSGNVFRAAHRHDGEFTFSPVSDEKGRAVAHGSGKLISFSPFRKSIFFNVLDNSEKSDTIIM